MDFIEKYSYWNYIFQFNNANISIPELVRKELINCQKFRFNDHIHYLYDSSGGRGNDGLKIWNALEVYKSDRIGYAGGITPDNVVSVLEEVCKSEKLANWIDLESGIRTDDKFDFDKAQLFLQNVLMFNMKVTNG